MPGLHGQLARAGTLAQRLRQTFRPGIGSKSPTREDRSGAGEGELMRKYITIFTYSSGSWARMINSPGDRTTAVHQTTESLGGSLESIYWELGTHDGDRKSVV